MALAVETIQSFFSLYGNRGRVNVWTKKDGACEWNIELEGRLVIDGPVVPNMSKEEFALDLATID
jgi:hypothetical protein